MRQRINGLTTWLSDGCRKRASAEADNVVKPLAHKLDRLAPVRCSLLLGQLRVVFVLRHSLPNSPTSANRVPARPARLETQQPK